MITIVDYCASNLASVKKAFDRVGAETVITSDAKVVSRAQKIVLPGVGNFAATKALDRDGLREALAAAILRGAPFLGICVGMQWLFASSEESAETCGLGLFSGVCGKFPGVVKSPHVGWNQLDLRQPSRLLASIPQNSFVYFTHSYRAPVVEHTVAVTEYGGAFSAAIERENVFAVQFHPEKSGDVGLQLLRNFCEMQC